MYVKLHLIILVLQDKSYFCIVVASKASILINYCLQNPVSSPLITESYQRRKQGRNTRIVVKNVTTNQKDWSRLRRLIFLV